MSARVVRATRRRPIRSASPRGSAGPRQERGDRAHTQSNVSSGSSDADTARRDIDRADLDPARAHLRADDGVVAAAGDARPGCLQRALAAAEHDPHAGRARARGAGDAPACPTAQRRSRLARIESEAFDVATGGRVAGAGGAGGAGGTGPAGVAACATVTGGSGFVPGGSGSPAGGCARRNPPWLPPVDRVEGGEKRKSSVATGRAGPTTCAQARCRARAGCPPGFRPCATVRARARGRWPRTRSSPRRR